MSKAETKAQPPRKHNPFLTDKARELWKRLDEQGKPVSKEELLKRVEALKAKSRSNPKR